MGSFARVDALLCISNWGDTGFGSVLHSVVCGGVLVGHCSVRTTTLEDNMTMSCSSVYSELFGQASTQDR